MKIYISPVPDPTTQMALGSAGVLGADIFLIEKAGGITAAYPISEQGKADLDTLRVRPHRQPEYNTSFYPIPMPLKNAMVFMERKFPVQYLQSNGDWSKSTTAFAVGDEVKWPESNYKDEILTVVNHTDVAPGDQKLVGHSQKIKVKDRHGNTSEWISGANFVLVNKAG